MKSAIVRFIAPLICAAFTMPSDGQVATDTTSTLLSERHSPSVALDSGLSLLRSGDTLAAYTVFESEAACASADSACRAVQGCAALLRPRALRLAAKQSLSGATVAPIAIKENALACAPFICAGAPADLQPLAAGFAEMLSTDFAQIQRFTVLERAQMRALTDEAALGQSGLLDSSQHCRLGKLIGAQWVVAGSYSGDDSSLSVRATVRSAVGNDSLAGSAAVSGQVKQLFKLEKELVFSLCKQWGIVLTDAERMAIETVPTENVLAFLAYSKGLNAEDAGNFPAASQNYREATRLDPAFHKAQEAQDRTQKALEAQKTERQKASGASPAGEIKNTAVFTIGPFQISGAGTAAVVGMNNVMAGFMPERPFVASGNNKVSAARGIGTASARQPLASERNSYIDATNGGPNAGSSAVKVRIPIPPTLGN